MLKSARLPASLRPVALIVLLTLSLSGCSLARFSDPSTASSLTPIISGNVHGGQQAVSGSTISLYAANATTLKGPSTSLLLTTVISDSGGNFNITNNYVCPTPSTLIYITATGGNPGLTPGTNNTGIAMMTALGTCGTFLTGGNSITVYINELTTIAAVEALAPYIADITHIGADTTANPNALSNSFTSANAIVPFYTGQFATQPAGTSFPLTLYNTLANIIASCINTAGNSGSTSNCYKLYNANAVVTDTFAALLLILQNPANTTPFTLAGGTSAPFQPALASQPVSFVPGLLINVPNNGEYRCCTSQMLSIDTAQQVWVGNFITHTVHTYSNAGVLLYTITLPQVLVNMASDPLGNTWFVVQATVPDTSYSILKYDSTGALQSPAIGWKANVGAGVQLYTYAGTAKDMKFDSLGNLFITGSQAGTAYPCVLKFANTGTYLQPICLGTSNGNVTGIAIDSSNNIYMAQNGGVNKMAKFTNLGVSISFTTQPALTSIVGDYFMHYDPVTDHIWVFDGNDVAIFASNGTTIKARFQDAFYFSNPFVLDGAGNGFTCCSYQFGVTRYDPTATRTSPDLGSVGSTIFAGFQVQGQSVPLPAMQVDGMGNIWAAGGDSILYRIGGGLAVPRSQLYR